MLKLLGNIIWILLGGIEIAICYFVGGLLLCLTILGIPFGIQLFKLGAMAMWPFGSVVVAAPATGGCTTIFFNILWFLVGGIWLAVTHFVLGILYCITLIGIPFGKQHFKLASLALSPFGKGIL